MIIPTITYNPNPFNFTLPDHLQCSLPTEERGIARDDVKLMVSHIHDDSVFHTQFKHIDQYLVPGDVLVVNTSGTMKSALEATRDDGTKLNVHLSTRYPEGKWVIELREVKDKSAKRFFGGMAGEKLDLVNGGQIELIRPYYQENESESHLQLWIAELKIQGNLSEYLSKYAIPIRYNYVKKIYPESYYQTVYANEPGSTEMPSAGRAFTHELITRLVAKGIQIIPIMLHTGVASLEVDEKPYAEFYRVSRTAAERINLARKSGHRVIATGTTVIRALETVTNEQGIVSSGEGWTNTYITPERGIHAVDGMITGMHEPRASHLLMLEALAGRQHLAKTYPEAIKHEYYWHEFGDLHLILP